MCEAEEQVRALEREIDWWQGRFEEAVELAADVERGIIDLPEFRRAVERLRVERFSRV